MIIIRKGKAKKKAFVVEKFPLSNSANPVFHKGFEEEEDIDDPKALQKFKKTHPLRRMTRFENELPQIIRFLWNPQTGELISEAGKRTEHALILANYKTFRGKQKGEVHPYHMWLRGFYFPRTNELAMRPFATEGLVPKKDMSFSLQGEQEEGEKEFQSAAWDFSRDIQQRLKDVLEKQLKKKFKGVHYDVDNYYLDKTFGIGGERW